MEGLERRWGSATQEQSKQGFMVGESCAVWTAQAHEQGESAVEPKVTGTAEIAISTLAYNFCFVHYFIAVSGNSHPERKPNGPCEDNVGLFLASLSGGS